MFQIIDNIIFENCQNELEEFLFNKEFIETFSPSTVEYSPGNIGHECWFVKQNKKLPLYQHIEPLFNQICSYLELDAYVADGRTFCQEISKTELSHDIIHVDRKCPHLVFLYYVSDSDGDTVLFNKRCEHVDDQFLEKDVILQPIQRISPKKGRVLIFDGLIYHATGIPKRKKRCVVNFNVFPY